MKIAVVCANGKAGSLIVREAVERGLDVTAVVRSENQSATQQVIQKDLFHLKASDLTGFDVVIDAFGTWTLETLPQHSTSLNHLCNILSGQDTRLLVVGGAGSLYVNPEHTAQVMDGVDFPAEFKPLASHMGKALEDLRTRNDVKWTTSALLGIFSQTEQKLENIFWAGRNWSEMPKGKALSAMQIMRLLWSMKR